MDKATRTTVTKARMTNLLTALGVVAATLSFSSQAGACNARGEYCNLPTWAANAFSGRYGRVPEASSNNKHHQVVRPSRPVQPEKVIAARKVAPVVRFADGFGRQFDPTSRVWFDGVSQCWFGREQFTFKGGDWYYGASEWTQSDGAWEVESGASPELVSCESVPSFAAKAAAHAAKAAMKAEGADKGATRTPAPATVAPVKIKTAEGESSGTAQKAAAPAECRKYFPSIGQMLTVPCGE